MTVRNLSLTFCSVWILVILVLALASSTIGIAGDSDSVPSDPSGRLLVSECPVVYVDGSAFHLCDLGDLMIAFNPRFEEHTNDVEFYIAVWNTGAPPITFHPHEASLVFRDGSSRSRMGVERQYAIPFGDLDKRARRKGGGDPVLIVVPYETDADEANASDRATRLQATLLKIAQSQQGQLSNYAMSNTLGDGVLTAGRVQFDRLRPKEDWAVPDNRPVRYDVEIAVGDRKLVYGPTVKDSRSRVATRPALNGYRGVVIPNLDFDPYGIGAAFRNQAYFKGFKTYLTFDEVPPAERPYTCLGYWSWSATEVQGQATLKFVDLVSHELIYQTTERRTNWWGAQQTVRAGARELWERVPYSGFDSAVHEQNRRLLYPERPILKFSLEAFKEEPASLPIVGVWVDPGNSHEVAIIDSPPGSEFDFVGIVTKAENPLWTFGEVMLELSNTAVPTAFIGNYYDFRKRRIGTPFTLDQDALLTFQYEASDGSRRDLTLVKKWPPANDVPEPERVSSHGTGFSLGGPGYLATNWHVVEDATEIRVLFPGDPEQYPATVVIKDSVNDLAILRVDADTSPSVPCSEPSYAIHPSGDSRLGETVSTIGYPLGPDFGTNPRFSSGTISSLSGIGDDPRKIQISAAIQPGNSGGPLFDGSGRIIGIVISTLNPELTYESTRALPQNVNFAIKAEYLLNLMAMLPHEFRMADQPPFDAERFSRCVVAIAATR